MVLHIFFYDKFAEDYIVRINRLYEGHLFFVYGEKKEKNFKSITSKNVVFSNQFENTYKWKQYLGKKIDEASRIIIHSIFSRQLLSVLLWKQKRNAYKYFWMIWGGDLYNAYWNRNNGVMKCFHELARKHFIKHVESVGYIKGDYRFLKKHYQTNASFHLASYTYDFFVPEDIPRNNHIINILLGNSASKSCQYEEILNKIAEFNRNDFTVYCVLSYPNDKEYIEFISKLGKEKLGDRFIPLTGFMPYDEYMTMLNSIDIAIFNHNRQQALGNIASLVYLGKKVFINNQNACKEYFLDMGAIVFDTEDFEEKTLGEKLETEIVQKNRNAIDWFYSDEQFKSRWDNIFYLND